MKDTVVLYHRGCNDGIVAAWAVREQLGDTAEYLPYQYGEEFPLTVFGKHVIMVDLSLPAERLNLLSIETKSVLIIDHHKTAQPLTQVMQPVATYQEYLKLKAREQGGKYILYDTAHSGAVLAWAFFHNQHALDDEHMPWALRLIQDYDLWQHKYPDTRPVNAWLINGGLTMDRVADLMADPNQIPTEVMAVGTALLKYDDKIIRSVIREYIEVGKMGKWQYAMLNAPHHLRNEVGERLADKFDFVILYTRRKERTVYSLRTKKGSGVDVSAIAEQFGGGGHAEAAAFSVPHGALEGNVFTRPTFTQRLRRAWTILKGQ